MKCTHLFDRNGPSTAYAVCFTLSALCLLTGFPRLQRNKTSRSAQMQKITARCGLDRGRCNEREHVSWGVWWGVWMKEGAKHVAK